MHSGGPTTQSTSFTTTLIKQHGSFPAPSHLGNIRIFWTDLAPFLSSCCCGCFSMCRFVLSWCCCCCHLPTALAGQRPIIAPTHIISAAPDTGNHMGNILQVDDMHSDSTQEKNKTLAPSSLFLGCTQFTAPPSFVSLRTFGTPPFYCILDATKRRSSALCLFLVFASLPRLGQHFCSEYMAPDLQSTRPFLMLLILLR